ncbi:efflux RND transporter permease subunit [Oleidesulfovibrio sp.]|uniref:efflux RND transporter permease subunit n=1 Tax=Oleidesulfovibrio sp. TaxID=2909707 RepID=UPI003A898044
MPHHNSGPSGFIASIVASFLTGKNALLLLIFGLGMGMAALYLTPKEEEPQIIVPMADILVQVPGASAAEVEKLVATPLERLLWQIDGVEHVYSISRRDSAMATVRFFVGEDREDSLIKLHNAITKNRDMVPDIVTGWAIKPVEIDDVPIVTLTLYPEAGTYDSHALRRMAEELLNRIAAVKNVSQVSITGGEPRQVHVYLDPERLTGFSVAVQDVTTALAGADASVTAGALDYRGRSLTITADSFLRSAREVRELVVGVSDGSPVYLGDVATVTDGPAHPVSYSRIGFSNRLAQEEHIQTTDSLPAVTLAVAKKKGTNAVTVAEEVIAEAQSLQREILPDGVAIHVTRNYGDTADQKVTDLITSLGFAIATVVGLLMLTLGRREALVVAVSVPLSFALALFVNYTLGYTINRVTLFALILSLGLVVDDPITNVDNIQRHILAKRRGPLEATLAAVQEVLPPVIMSTLAIIVCFTPMFFITGMMGPYMAPMAANVPLTVIFSTLAALTVVPWLSYLLLRSKGLQPDMLTTDGENTQADTQEGASPRAASRPRNLPERIYRRTVTPLLDSAKKRRIMLAAIIILLIASCSLALFRLVPLKMLPFDNKNEFQIVIDMPEGTSLEETDRVVRSYEAFLRTVPEVSDFTTYTGTASPMDFNGMVRHYYMRSAPHQADIRVNLADKSRRTQQSHTIVLRLRNDLQAIANAAGAHIKLVEVPPGPPVFSTITGEVYGTPDKSLAQLHDAANHVLSVMQQEQGVTDIDSTMEEESTRINFVTDRVKAALHGVETEDIARTLRVAVGGEIPANVHEPHERQPLPVVVRLPRESRSSEAKLESMPVRTAQTQEAPQGSIVPLGELGHFERVPEDQPIYHKNLHRVVYVYGEMAGRAPGEAILDMSSALKKAPMPPDTYVEWAGEGEWEITIRVFRDLGLAFGAALAGIYILLVIQTGVFALPLLIMSAIPLTLLGIMPGFWLLNLLFAGEAGGYADPIFFTATSMIGMIALGGIVIRNSLVLIEFIQDALKQGLPLREAVLESGTTRLRPILLTAATTLLGAWPITLDPIFSGLAWALIFGLIASTIFSLVVVPVAFYSIESRTNKADM